MNILILDVDGTLTNGGITYSDCAEYKTFDVKDGLILYALSKINIPVIFLTGRSSAAVQRRAKDLGAEAIQGVSDKLSVLRKLFAERNIAPSEAAYIGDDLNDYEAMAICGFAACPSDASPEIKAVCDYISPYRGGNGAVRDIVEHILKKASLWEEVLGIYGVTGTKPPQPPAPHSHTTQSTPHEKPQPEPPQPHSAYSPDA